MINYQNYQNKLKALVEELNYTYLITEGANHYVKWVESEF